MCCAEACLLSVELRCYETEGISTNPCQARLRLSREHQRHFQESINGTSLVLYKIETNLKPSHTAAPNLARPALLRSAQRSRQSASPVTAHGERSASSDQPRHSAGREARRRRRLAPRRETPTRRLRQSHKALSLSLSLSLSLVRPRHDDSVTAAFAAPRLTQPSLVDPSLIQAVRSMRRLRQPSLNGP